MKQCKLVLVAVTVTLLAALCHATPAHVTGSRAVKGTQKSVGRPEARETDTEIDSSDEVTSSTQPSEGEYIILDKNGDEEASIVVSKGSVKAKEEANLMSLYQWLAAYFEGKGQETTGKHHEHWGPPPKGGYYQQSYNPAYHPGYPYPNYRGYGSGHDYRSASSFSQFFPNFQSSSPYTARNYYSAQSSYPGAKYGQYPYGQFQFGGYPQHNSFYGGYYPYGANPYTSRYSQYGGYGGQPQNNMYQYPNYPSGNYQNLGRFSQYGTSQVSVPKFNNFNSNSYMIKYPQYTESDSVKEQHRGESEFSKYFPDLPATTSTSDNAQEKSAPSDQGSYQYGVYRQV